MTKELADLALEIKRLADREVREASNLARQASAGEALQELSDTREELLDLAQDTKEETNPHETAAELSQIAQDLVEPLLEEANDLNEAAEDAEAIAQLTPEKAKEQAAQRNA